MLTDDHLDKSAGRREHLVGKIQENYGVAEHEAECQVMDWEHGIRISSRSPQSR